jgi:RES domain-containing protein
MEILFVEMAYGFAHRFEPLTICSYNVDVDGIVDLRTAVDCKSAGIDWADIACSWKLELANGIEPASWRVAKQLMARPSAGILVPSFAQGAAPSMHNLVLWNWGPNLPHKVHVHDPSGRLPKDQLSWR